MRIKYIVRIALMLFFLIAVMLLSLYLYLWNIMWKSNPLPHAEEEELLGCLSNAKAVQVLMITKEFERAESGSELFEETINLLAKAIKQGPKGRPYDPDFIEGQIIDFKGSKCLTFNIYSEYFQINNHFFSVKGVSIGDMFERAHSKKFYFYPSGARKAEGIHNKGKKIGHWVFYFENGEKQEEGDYVDGEKEGVWSFWDGNGELVGKERYKYGSVVSD